jgi:aspartate racemase
LYRNDGWITRVVKHVTQNSHKRDARVESSSRNGGGATNQTNEHHFSIGNYHLKRLGLIGGTSWHSTIQYYSAINEAVNEHFGNNTNPPLLLVNVNQAAVHQFQKEDRWDKIAEMFTTASQQLIAAGAEAIMFCANTPHRIYEQVQSEISVPILHIADATANAIKDQSVDSVAFIGTKYSMEQDFVTERIGNHGIKVHVPEEPETRDELHRIIQQELTFGIVKDTSKDYVINAISAMQTKGAQGTVLGCTEFPLMFPNGVLGIPAFNTTTIHAAAAVEFILSDES